MAFDYKNWKMLEGLANVMTVKQATKTLCEFLDSDDFKEGRFAEGEDVKACVIRTHGGNY